MAPKSSRNETDRCQRGGVAARLGATLSTLLLLLFVFAAAALPQQRPGLPSKRVTTSKNAPSGPKYRPGRVLVRFRAGTAKQTIAAAHAAVQAEVVKEYRYVSNLQAVRLPDGKRVEEAIQKYRKDPNVLYAQPDYAVHAADGAKYPNDPYFVEGYLWGLSMISAPEAWGLTTGSPSVVVVGIDTGIDYKHPDLAANMFRNTPECTPNGSDDDGDGFIDDCYGINAITGSGDPMDDNGHGTHTAGTIGAVGNNGLGVVGVNWNIQLMACKFLDANGGGYDSDAITCLDYAAYMKDRGVNIVATNNSWGSYGWSQALRDAIEVQEQKGILFIAAAGNDENDNDWYPFYPASYDLPNIIAVAATDDHDDLAACSYDWCFSNYGAHTVHLGAPGYAIFSTLPGNSYGFESGTSMAAPHVTGVAALLAAHDPTLDWRAIKNLILAGGDPNEMLFGYTLTSRRLNANGSLTCTNSAVYPTLRPIPTYMSVGPGVPVDLRVLNINCAVPSGDVPISVYSEDTEQTQTVTLLDDGVGSDQVAGDGIYSAQWIPPALGWYELSGFPDGTYVTAQAVPAYLFGSTAYNYVPITGTNLELSDVSAATVALDSLTPPLSIPFGGSTYSSVNVGSNGVLSFTDFIPWDYGVLPTWNFQTVVAPFWTDLYPMPGTDQNVFWDVVGTAPNRQLVIEWRNVPPYYSINPTTETVTFEVVFAENSPNIVFNYLDTVYGGSAAWADHGADAVVGVQTGYDFATVYSMWEPSLNDSSAIAWQLQYPVVLSPASLNFGDVAVGSSASQTITLSNVGTATVNISAIAGSGDFAVSGGTCSTSLPMPVAAGSSCTIIVTFTPSVLGDSAGTLTVTDDAMGSPQTASLAGRGVSTGGVVISVPSALGFGDQQRGTTSSPLTVTVTNSGAGVLGILSVQISGEFALASGTTCPTPAGTLAPGASCAFLVTFNPVLDGPQKGALVVNHDAAGSPLVVSLSGNGTPNFLMAGLTWRQRAPFMDPRTGGGGIALAAASLINGTLYVSHGYGWNGISPYLSVYDVAAGSWTYGGATAPDASYPREALGAGIAYGKHYAIGGYGYSGEGWGVSGANEAFDPSGHIWTSTLAPLPTPVSSPGLASWNDLVYVVGGYDQYWNPLGLNQVYDPGTDAWATLTPLPTPVTESATAAYDGKIYVFGGWTGGAGISVDVTGPTNLVHLHARTVAQASDPLPLTDAVQIYDIASDKWTTGIPMPAPLAGALAGVIGNQLTVSGGYDSYDTVNGATFLYDPATDSWSAGPDMSAAAAYAAQGVTGDGTQVFAVGGADINWNIGWAVQVLGPAVEVSPPSLSFGDQPIGTTSASLGIDVRNHAGTAVTITGIEVTGANFDIANDCGTSLLPGADCLVTADFTPSAPGPITGTLTVTDSASPAPHVVNLSGNGVGPFVSLSPTSLTFANQPVGVTSAAQTVTLTNSGNAALTMSSITTTADFAESSTCGTSLDVGASCVISITFTPPVIGNISGFLLINDNAAGSPHMVILSGNGVGAVVSVSPTSITFADTQAGTSSGPQTITISNTGNASLTVSGIASSGDFAQTNTCSAPVGPGSSCAISITFSPTAIGPLTGLVIISDNAPNSPQAVSLAGNGIGPYATPAPALLAFATQVVATKSSTQAVTLTNTGTQPLLISAIGISSDFAETHNCGSSLAPRASCTFNIAFAPQAAGNRAGALAITDNAYGSPHLIALSGVGADFSIASAAGASVPAVSIAAGQTATFNLSVAGSPGFSGTVSFGCSGAPEASTCSVSPRQVPVNGTTAAGLKVTVQTTARSVVPPSPRSTPPLAQWGIWWAVLGLFMLAVGALYDRRRRAVLALAGLLLMAGLWAACGGGGGQYVTQPTGTPAGTYSLTVTGTYTTGSGQVSALSHNITLTLNVN